MTPGLKAFTRIPNGAHSAAMLRVSATSAAFDAAYSPCPTEASSAA